MDLMLMHYCSLNKTHITLELPNAVMAPMSGSSSQKLALRGYMLENRVFDLWLTGTKRTIRSLH